MSNYPSIKMHTCSENVTNADFVDIDYSAAGFTIIPTITVTPIDNINIFISDITASSARINFSTNYTGVVHYSAISIS